MPQIRCRASELGVRPAVSPFQADDVRLGPRAVRHTSHPTVGYLIETPGSGPLWAPDFWAFPDWAAGVDLMFADAAGWNRTIRFAGGAGGHACVRDTAVAARRAGVHRLIFAHIGRSVIRLAFLDEPMTLQRDTASTEFRRPSVLEGQRSLSRPLASNRYRGVSAALTPLISARHLCDRPLLMTPAQPGFVSFPSAPDGLDDDARG